MINIVKTEPPKSLDTPEIRDYIDNAIKYLDDPENLIKPDKPGTYRNSDLLEAFDRDFFSKCYLTEQKFENSWVMDIEHFIPQSERPDLIYEWNNLFPAEHHANMMKPRKTPNGGYLNPCDPGDDVENDIIYSLSAHGFDPDFIAKDNTNIKAVNTCNLLKRLHNGHDSYTNKVTKTLRHAIHKKYIEILKKIIEYQQHPSNSIQKFQTLRELRDYLSRKSSFTMLCRSIPAIHSINENLFD
ncbi:MAG: hypothetical protein LBH44_03295 [Treponema sp.]|jgi:hypothetical protein|nr:hypothetical protein [Treponema sp.]